MNMILDSHSNRDEWLRRRREVLSGHDMSALAGVNPYRTKIHVFADKVHGEEPIEQSAAMTRGKILEPALLAHFEERLGRKFARPGFIVDPDRKFLGGTLDALDEHDGGTIVEVKTISFRSRHRWGPGGTEDCDPAALVQAHHYAGLVGAKRILVIAFDTSTDEILEYPMDVDGECVTALRGLGASFWFDHVIAKTPPAIEDDDTALWRAANEVLDRVHRRDNGKAIDAPPAMQQAAFEYEAARAAEKAAHDQKEAAAGKLKAFLGESSKATWGDGRVNWSSVKGREETDWKAIAETLGATPDLIAKHTARGAGHRRLFVTLKGTKEAA